MKKFRLSKPYDRVMGIAIATLATAGLGLLIYAMRHDTGLLIFCALAAVLICGLMVMYVINVFRAVCIADAETKKVDVRGLKNYELDVSEATLVQTVVRKNGQMLSRIIVFCNDEEKIIGAVPTMHTYRGGIWADPLAREMAEHLGIPFQQSVPDWEFDMKKYREHMQEEEEKQRQADKERRKKKLQLRIQKLKDRKK